MLCIIAYANWPTNFERTRRAQILYFPAESLSEPFPTQPEQLYLVRFSFDFTQKQANSRTNS